MDDPVNGRALVGFLSRTEAVAWLRYVSGSPRPTGELEDVWERSRAAASARLPLAHGPLRLECPGEAAASTAGNRSVQAALQSFGGMQPRVVLAPLERLVTFQIQVNADYIQLLRKQVSSFVSTEDVVGFCFPRPVDTPVDAVQGQDLFVSDNPNLTVLDVRPGRARHRELGTDHPVFTVMVGVGNQAATVIRFKERLIVLTGYQRLLALLEEGYAEAPVVMVQPRDRAGLASLGIPPGPTFWFQLPTLMLPRPPLLRDFADSQVAVNLRMRKAKKIVQVTYRIIERLWD